jgi:hypothetical protein
MNGSNVNGSAVTPGGVGTGSVTSEVGAAELLAIDAALGPAVGPLPSSMTPPSTATAVTPATAAAAAAGKPKIVSAAAAAAAVVRLRGVAGDSAGCSWNSRDSRSRLPGRSPVPAGPCSDRSNRAAVPTER